MGRPQAGSGSATNFLDIPAALSASGGQERADLEAYSGVLGFEVYEGAVWLPGLAQS